MLSDRYIPAPLSVKQVAYIIPSADGREPISPISEPLSTASVIPQAMRGFNRVQTTSVLEPDGSFRDVTAFPAPAVNEISISAQKKLGQYPVSPEKLAEDPDDPSTYSALYTQRRPAPHH